MVPSSRRAAVLIPFLISAASYASQVALQVSGYHDPVLARRLGFLAILALVVAFLVAILGYWPWLRRIRLRSPFRLAPETHQQPPDTRVAPVAAAQVREESQADFERKLLLSKIEEFERRGAALTLQLAQEMESGGSQIRPHLRALLEQWARDGNQLFDRVDAVQSAMFITDQPGPDDRYEGTLWQGYLNRRLGHVRQMKDATRNGRA